MKGNVRSTRRLIMMAVPVTIIVLGLLLLVGCIYVPIPEHLVDEKQKDFRDMVGPKDSRKPIRPGATSDIAILGLLGPPPFESADGRAIGYVVGTHAGYIFSPLCFTGGPREVKAYLVRFTFNDQGMLSSWEIVDWSYVLDQTLGILINSTLPPESDALEKMNQHGPKLERKACQP